jgi:hypothetical protein
VFFRGGKRYVDFRLVNDDNAPVTGRRLADLSVAVRRNNQPVTEQLALAEHGQGEYTLSYTPSDSGHDYVEIYDEVLDIRVIDAEDIQDSINSSARTVLLDQDFGGQDALRVQEDNPSTLTLLVYDSSEWEQGFQDVSHALGSTALRYDGRWVSQILVTGGTYHLVLSGFRFTKIFRYRFTVVPPDA